MASFLNMLGDRSSKLWVFIRPAVLVLIYYIGQKILYEESGFEWWVYAHDTVVDGVTKHIPSHLGLDSKNCIILIASSLGFDLGIKRPTTNKLSGEK